MSDPLGIDQVSRELYEECAKQTGQKRARERPREPSSQSGSDAESACGEQRRKRRFGEIERDLRGYPGQLDQKGDQIGTIIVVVDVTAAKPRVDRREVGASQDRRSEEHTSE